MNDRQYYGHMVRAHYVVEGQMFPSVKSVHLTCVARGCDTWAALSAPKTDKMDRCNAGRAKRQRESREEMARLCAELDKRKADL